MFKQQKLHEHTAVQEKHTLPPTVFKKQILDYSV